MQEVLVATEKFELECMEAAEREQREARKTKKPPSITLGPHTPRY